ncbi:MAG: MarR family transcriptional regulator [Acidimicrobiales bacterium]
MYVHYPRAMAGPLRFDPIVEAHRQWLVHDLDEPLAMAAATSIMRAQQLVSADVERALDPFGLTFSRWELLMLLSFSRSGRLPITKAGARLMIHPTGVSKLVDKLEAQGFVRRLPDPDDRRTTLASILPPGRRVARRAAKAVAAVRYGLDLSVAELEAIVGVLRSVRESAGDFAG